MADPTDPPPEGRLKTWAIGAAALAAWFAMLWFMFREVL
jgi:hypothetical protein